MLRKTGGKNYTRDIYFKPVNQYSFLLTLFVLACTKVKAEGYQKIKYYLKFIAKWA